MVNRKHKLPATFIMVFIIGLIGFKDMGMFFKAYASIKGDNQIAFEKAEAVAEDSINYGTSKVNKIIRQDKLIYSLVKGDAVAIEDFKDNMYIVVDENGNEFKINETYIDRKSEIQKTTRRIVSRKSIATTKVVSAAYNSIGTPYVGGDTGKRGYDCSGLTYSIYLKNLDIKINRISRDQIKNGVNIKKNELIPGDLVFFKTSGSGIGHVGLYIGDGNMIHASSGRKQVIISAIDETYYKTRYVGATRIIN